MNGYGAVGDARKGMHPGDAAQHRANLEFSARKRAEERVAELEADLAAARAEVAERVREAERQGAVEMRERVARAYSQGAVEALRALAPSCNCAEDFKFLNAQADHLDPAQVPVRKGRADRLDQDGSA